MALRNWQSKDLRKFSPLKEMRKLEKLSKSTSPEPWTLTKGLQQSKECLFNKKD